VPCFKLTLSNHYNGALCQQLFCLMSLASQSSGRRRQVLERIRAKRETNIKTEDSEECVEDNGTNVDSAGSETNVSNAVNEADVKSLLAEYALCT